MSCKSDSRKDLQEPVKAGQGMADVTMMGWGSTCPHANAICAPNDLYELTVPVSTQAKCMLVVKLVVKLQLVPKLVVVSCSCVCPAVKETNRHLYLYLIIYQNMEFFSPEKNMYMWSFF